MEVSALPDSVIVLRSGADSEMVSGFSREETRLIADAPGVLRDENGPVASAELFAIINLPKQSTGTDANVPLRGVEQAAMTTRGGIDLLEGRMFERGRSEVIVGVGANREFEGLDVGSTIKVGRYEWAVVGLFSADGGVAESEIWTDAPVLQDAYDRGDSFQSVRVRLNSVGSYGEFKDALTSDPRLSVKIGRLAVETGYYELYEVERGEFRLTGASEKLLEKQQLVPVRDYLQTQTRFKALTDEQLADIQARIKTKWDAHYSAGGA